MNINRENNIIRLKNRAAVHIKELGNNNFLFNEKVAVIEKEKPWI